MKWLAEKEGNPRRPRLKREKSGRLPPSVSEGRSEGWFVFYL